MEQPQSKPINLFGFNYNTLKRITSLHRCIMLAPTIVLAVAGCQVSYSEADVIEKSFAEACVGGGSEYANRACSDSSVNIESFAISWKEEKLTACLFQPVPPGVCPDPATFLVTDSPQLNAGQKFRLKGVIINSPYFSSFTHMRASNVETINLTEREQVLRKEEEMARNSREHDRRQQEISDSRVAGERARYLSEWDSAIANNNATLKADLERASASHSRTLVSGRQVDTYVLKDGRAIACSTSASGPSPPIMTCDGSP